jgi:glycosyltransferase involved in cell wall biosynthesis
VVVAPLLEGGGTRLKIVEAWSQGKAVVATTKGVEGLPWTPAVAAVADGVDEFAGHLRQLISDGARRRAMGAAGLMIFYERLSWDVARRTVGAGSILAPAGRPSDSARVTP